MDSKMKNITRFFLKNRSNKRQVIMSVVSLILATLVLMSATYSWFIVHQSVGYTDQIKLDTGKGLRVNDLENTLENISDKSFLLPASSLDGRNLFFAADGSEFRSTSTEKLTYRNANVGDKNVNYVQVDFQLTAEANNTGVYLDTTAPEENNGIPRTHLYFTGWKNDEEAKANGWNSAEEAIEYSKALRVALFYEGMDDNKPIVFSSQNQTVTTDAVTEIDRTSGEYLDSERQIAYSFKDYAYGKKQIITMNQAETRNFSLILWLEGTDEKHCISEKVIGKKIDFSFALTTSWENTVKIRFRDDQNQIADFLDSKPQYSLILNYNDPSHGIVDYKVTMYKENEQENGHVVWYCNIPGTAYNDITFEIVDDANRKIYGYNFDSKSADTSRPLEWTKTKSGVSTKYRGESTLYINDGWNNGYYAGHWYDGEIEEKGDGGDSGEVGGDDDW